MLRAVPLALLLILCKTSAAAGFADLVERITPSVVGVGSAYPPRAPTGGRPPRRLMGTGFVVQTDSDTFVVTNSHVIPSDLDSDGREGLAIFSGSGNSASQRFARVLKNDPVHDLAILSYQGARLPAMILAQDDRVRPGDRVAFTGFPIGAVLGLYPSTHEGIVAAITPLARPVDQGRELSALQMSRLRRPFDVYQLDAIAYPGNSGSAVYRSDTGEVIGVMNSVFVKESRETLLSTPSGIAYAIPVKHLKNLLDSFQTGQPQ